MWSIKMSMAHQKSERDDKGDIRHKKDGKIDSISAKIILERWLYDKN